MQSSVRQTSAGVDGGRIALDRLGELVVGEQPLPAVLDTLLALATSVLPPAVETSVTLLRGDEPSTAAFSGQVAVDLDERQYDQGHGPCLDAATAGELVHIPDMDAERRWPQFAAAARAAGIGSSLSVPLPVQRQVIGALNIYSRERGPFDDDTVELARKLASHAAVALATAQLYEAAATLASQMRDAMASRSTIEQAKGIIMRDRGCGPEDAFEALVQLSQEAHVKLRDIASMLVEQVRER